MSIVSSFLFVIHRLYQAIEPHSTTNLNVKSQSREINEGSDKREEKKEEAMEDERRRKEWIPSDYANAPAACREPRPWPRWEVSWWQRWSRGDGRRRRCLSAPHYWWRRRSRPTKRTMRRLSGCRSRGRLGRRRRYPTGAALPPPSWSAVPRSTVRTSRCGRTRTAARTRSAPPRGAAPSSCGRWLRCSSSRSDRNDEETRKAAGEKDLKRILRRCQSPPTSLSMPGSAILLLASIRRVHPFAAHDWLAIKTCSWYPGGCRPELGCVQHLKREWKGTFWLRRRSLQITSRVIL